MRSVVAAYLGVLAVLGLMAVMVIGDGMANRRVRLENERRQREYEIERAAAKRENRLPPVPPNRLARQ